jgi:hypothetical protein
MVLLKDPEYSFWILKPDNSSKTKRRRYAFGTSVRFLYKQWQARYEDWEVQLSYSGTVLNYKSKALISDLILHNVPQSILVRILMRPFFFVLPGDSILSFSAPDTSYSLDQFKERFTFVPGSNYLIELDGAGERVPPDRLRLHLDTVPKSPAEYRNTFGELASATSMSGAITILLLSPPLRVTFRDKTTDIAVPIGVPVEFAEHWLSREYRHKVAVDLSDCFVAPGSLFDPQALGLTSLTLRPASDRLYPFRFHDAPERYFRFPENANIAEVKTVVAPQLVPRNFDIFLDNEALPSDTTLADLGHLHRPQFFFVSAPTAAPVTFALPGGYETAVVPHKGRRTAKAVKHRLTPHNVGVSLELLGEPLDRLTYTRRAKIQVVPGTATIAVLDGCDRNIVPYDRGDTIGTLWHSLRQNQNEYLDLIVDGLMPDYSTPLSSFPPQTTIYVYRFPTIDDRQTIGHVRAKESNRVVYRRGETVLVNAVPLVLAGRFVREPSIPRAPEKFEIPFPAWRDLPVRNNSRRSFYFDYESQVNDVIAVASDLTGIADGRLRCSYRGWVLEDAEYLFDVGYDGSAPLEISLTPPDPDAILFRFEDDTEKSLVCADREIPILDLAARLKAESGWSPGVEIELVCLGQCLIGTNTVAESRLNSESIVFVYVHPETRDVDRTGTDLVFEFEGGSTALPAAQVATVRDVKITLQKRLLKALDEMSVIDVTRQVMLRDQDKIGEFATGRPFWVASVDQTRRFTADDNKLLNRFAPSGLAKKERVLLFRRCDYRPTVFLTTARKRATERQGLPS